MAEELHQFKNNSRRQKLTEVLDYERERRVRSTDELERAMAGREMTEGKQFHVQTAGLIDMSSNIFWMIRRFGGIKRLFISSYALIGSDILLIREQCQAGKIQHLTVMHDEDYRLTHQMDVQLLHDMLRDGYIHSLIQTTMHSKFILAEVETGKKIVIVTSANMTYNPRIEMQSISVNATLYDQYISITEMVNDSVTELRTARRFAKMNRYEPHTAFHL